MTQEQVFERILGEPVSLSGRYRNPFRDDTNPTCYFTKKSKWLRFIDPAANQFSRMNYREFFYYWKTGDFIKTTEDFKHCMDMLEADGFKDVVGYKSTYAEQQNKFQAHIEFDPKPFTSKDKWYWRQFGITFENLEDDGVYSVKAFRYNTKKEPDVIKEIFPSVLSYAITCKDKVKIYQPYSKFKWLTNFDNSCSFKWDGFGKTLVFGSYKDGRVAANLGFDSWAAPFETIAPQGLNGSEVFIGDFDRPGNEYKKGKPSRMFYPEVPPKDLGEIYYHYGPDFTKQFLLNLTYGTY